MGSDLYMEQRNFRPRPNKAEWEMVDGKMELFIYRDVFYHGWQMEWHGDVNEHNESLVKVMVKKIPNKPEPPYTFADAVDEILAPYVDDAQRRYNLVNAIIAKAFMLKKEL